MKNLDQLSEDILNTTFTDIFRSIHFIQSILGVLRVNIKQKYVTSPTNHYQIYVVFILIINLVLTIECISRFDTIFISKTTENCLKLAVVITQIMNAIVAINNACFNGQKNSKLYVKLQKIDRQLQMKNTLELNMKISATYVSLTVFTITSGVVMVISVIVCLMKTFDFSLLIISIIALGIYTEVILFIFMVHFVNLRMGYINNVLHEVHDPSRNAENGIWMIKENIDSGEGEVDTRDGRKIVSGLHCVIDVVADLMNLYQFPVLCFTIQILMWYLVIMQTFIMAIKDQTSDLISTLYLLPMHLLTVVAFALCYVGNKLQTSFQKTKKLCNSFLAANCEGNQRENTKKILKLLRVKREMTVYDIFTLDYQLPLTLFAVTASYTIVLFQFALL